jgi:uncharacterized protein with PhoU and TrkA domain
MLKSDDNLRMEEIVIPEGFDSKHLGLLNSGSKEYVVLAIRRPKGKWLFNPQGQQTINADDVMMMTTPEG